MREQRVAVAAVGGARPRSVCPVEVPHRVEARSGTRGEWHPGEPEVVPVEPDQDDALPDIAFENGMLSVCDHNRSDPRIRLRLVGVDEFVTAQAELKAPPIVRVLPGIVGEGEFAAKLTALVPCAVARAGSFVVVPVEEQATALAAAPPGRLMLQ